MSLMQEDESLATLILIKILRGDEILSAYFLFLESPHL